MTNKVISEAAKVDLINAIKHQLANDKDEQYSVAAHGYIGVYKMNEEQLLAEFKSYNIYPYEV